MVHVRRTRIPHGGQYVWDEDEDGDVLFGVRPDLMTEEEARALEGALNESTELRVAARRLFGL